MTNPQLFLRLDNLEAKYKTDGRLKELLVKASLNRIKKDEVAELQQIVKRIVFNRHCWDLFLIHCY